VKAGEIPAISWVPCEMEASVLASR